MSHIGNKFCEEPFRMRWYRLDSADVYELLSFLSKHFYDLPVELRQPALNLYNDLCHPKNPRNKKFE